MRAFMVACFVVVVIAGRSRCRSRQAGTGAGVGRIYRVQRTNLGAARCARRGTMRESPVFARIPCETFGVGWRPDGTETSP